MDHHPDLEISWSEVEVSITNHAAGGLTEADFELADQDRRAERDVAPRTDVRFRSPVTTECAAWLYRPDGRRMARSPASSWRTGSAGVKEARLDAYAERFAAGRPRGARLRLPLPRRLRRRAAAADRHRPPARGLACGDRLRARPRRRRPNRIVAWGTSFSGGHVVELGGGRRSRIAAVIAQGPFMSGVAVLRSAGIGTQQPAHGSPGCATWSPAVAGAGHPIAVVGPPGIDGRDGEPGRRARLPGAVPARL